MRIHRTIGYLLLVAAIGASGLALAPRSARAALECNGLPATIEVTEPGTIYGTGGADVIAGLRGHPTVTVYAFGGNDTICVGSYSTVYAGSGDDVVRDSVWGGVCSSRVYLGSGDDSGFCSYEMWGEAGNDNLDFGAYLYGGSGNDSLSNGRETVLGGLCDGGSGRDSAVDCDAVVNVP